MLGLTKTTSKPYSDCIKTPKNSLRLSKTAFQNSLQVGTLLRLVEIGGRVQELAAVTRAYWRLHSRWSNWRLKICWGGGYSALRVLVSISYKIHYRSPFKMKLFSSESELHRGLIRSAFLHHMQQDQFNTVSKLQIYIHNERLDKSYINFRTMKIPVRLF